MPETTNIPGAGKVNQKFVIGGVVLVAGVVGWAYLHRTQTVAGPDVGEEAVGTELPPADVGSVSTGGGTSDTGIQFITTNAQWTVDAVGKMTDLGFDAIAVSTALGKYLANQTITTQEALYVQTALAVSGKPPEGEHSIRFEPVSPPSDTTQPKKYDRTTATWLGHRVATPGITLAGLAAQYSHYKTPAAIGSTLDAIKDRNPSVAKVYGSVKPMKVGTIVLVPIWK